MKHLNDGDFASAWGGIASLQLTLSVAWTVGQQHGWSRELLAAKLSRRPAEIFGLSARKGAIKVGNDADLVIWNPESSFTVVGKQLHHRHKITPYEAVQLSGVVEQTWLRGRQIYSGGLIAGEACGNLVRRHGPPTRIANTLNQLTGQSLESVLETCCASAAWIRGMIDGGRILDDAEVFRRCDAVWSGVSESDWIEAFEAHPKIGDVDSLREKFANTKKTATGEQAAAASASDDVLQQLAVANEDYFAKFGFIFIVFATGKSAQQMLALLMQRLPNDRETELRNAAAEQLKITRLRLRKLTQTKSTR